MLDQTLRRLIPTALLVSVSLVACSDSDTPGDVGQPDASVSADAQARPDAAADSGSALPDAGDTMADATSPDVTSLDAAEVSPDAQPGPDAEAPRPVVHVLSPTGHDRLFGAAFDADDGLIAVGVITTGTSSPDQETVVIRVRADGTLDPAFGSGGVFRRNLAVGGTGELARGVVVQSNGRIVVAASVEQAGAVDVRERDVALLGLTRTGTVDQSFGTEGLVILDLAAGAASGNTFVTDAPWGLARADDDSLVLMASRKHPQRADSDYTVVKLTPRGQLDRSFGVEGLFDLDIDNQNASARSVTVLPDGSIIGGGYMTSAGTVLPVVFKLDARGALDPGFGARGVFSTTVLSSVTEVYAVVPVGDGLVTAGYGREAAMGTNDWVSLRLSGGGALDRGYGAQGAAVVDIGGFADNCRDLVALPDGRTLHVGNGRTSASDNDAAIVVLTSTGGLDRSFGPRGRRVYDLGSPSDAFWDVARAADGRVAVVGLRGSAAGGNDDAAVLLLPAP